ncbi:MAG: hypothetical protein PQJ61_14770 [Spirochaetales bacterium]|uniref:Uncharacterized protein n=1 Tax=Candidatus Thalassospirochaeta sargassi TaxID=3119039 RepID=A0AAJ1IHH1_9SPIO|nr:hypothetical protein [Spirochaetales bacterium]
MNIYINEQQIDFKLENETVLREVIAGLDSWAGESGYHMQEIFFDDKDYFEGSNDETPVESIKELRVTAKNSFQIHQDNLQLLYQYVSLFVKSLEGGNKKLLDELKENAEPVTGLLADFLGEKIDSEDAVSAGLLTNINLFDPETYQTDDEHFITLVRQLTGLKIILNERISELSDPIGELGKTVKALKLSQEEINNISVLLQTGKDREALNSIIRFSELSQKTLRLYQVLKNTGYVNLEELVVDGKKFSEYYLDLNGILSELLEAFTANDSVLIGDLLEYEIAPRLESLTTVLEEILKENQQ